MKCELEKIFLIDDGGKCIGKVDIPNSRNYISEKILNEDNINFLCSNLNVICELSKYLFNNKRYVKRIYLIEDNTNEKINIYLYSRKIGETTFLISTLSTGFNDYLFITEKISYFLTKKLENEELEEKRIKILECLKCGKIVNKELEEIIKSKIKEICKEHKESKRYKNEYIIQSLFIHKDIETNEFQQTFINYDKPEFTLELRSNEKRKWEEEYVDDKFYTLLSGYSILSEIIMKVSEFFNCKPYVICSLDKEENKIFVTSGINNKKKIVFLNKKSRASNIVPILGELENYENVRDWWIKQMLADEIMPKKTKIYEEFLNFSRKVLDISGKEYRNIVELIEENFDKINSFLLERIPFSEKIGKEEFLTHILTYNFPKILQHPYFRHC